MSRNTLKTDGVWAVLDGNEKQPFGRLPAGNVHEFKRQIVSIL